MHVRAFFFQCFSAIASRNQTLFDAICGPKQDAAATDMCRSHTLSLMLLIGYRDNRLDRFCHTNCSAFTMRHQCCRGSGDFRQTILCWIPKGKPFASAEAPLVKDEGLQASIAQVRNQIGSLHIARYSSSHNMHISDLRQQPTYRNAGKAGVIYI